MIGRYATLPLSSRTSSPPARLKRRPGTSALPFLAPDAHTMLVPSIPKRSLQMPSNTPTWPPHPPPDETELEKAVRLEEEKVAKRIRCVQRASPAGKLWLIVDCVLCCDGSEEIDRQIERDRQELKKRRLETKILLLGACPPRVSSPQTLLSSIML